MYLVRLDCLLEAKTIKRAKKRGKGMKKAVVSGVVVIFVILGIGMSYMLFRGGIRTEKEQKSYEEQEKQVENLMKPGQEGEADDRSEAFSEALKEKAGLTVDPQNIVSTGSPITSGNYSFTVNSWSVSKESPGYALPEGMDATRGGLLQIDANGNITNEYSYVVVDLTVENKAEEPVTDLLWGYLRMQAFDMGDFISEVAYLGEETPRKSGHDSYEESFKAGEIKKYPVVFVMPDEIVNNQEIYLEIDTSGGNPQPEDPEFAVKRFIILD